MGNFSCTECGGEFFIPLRTTYFCPNCNIQLPDTTPAKVEEARKEAKMGWDDQGTPVEYTTEELEATLEPAFASVLDRALSIWRARQAKYGPTNIAATGALGCYVRACDKLARLREVYLRSRGAEATDETITDSWLDLLNYAAMGLMCHEGSWPGVNK